jgi:hypothetical protein
MVEDIQNFKVLVERFFLNFDSLQLGCKCALSCSYL